MEDPQQQQVNNPHIKKVLKTYQLSAPRSLQGPNSVLDEPSGSAVAVCSPKGPIPLIGYGCDSESGSGRKSPVPIPPPLPPPLHPVLYVPDQSGCELFDTGLEWEKIACFMVGGEMRLCLPQILNTVLRDFTLTQINQVCDELRIYCSRCTPEQLDVLKNCQVLPASAPSCGLMTKTNAERLCFALLHRIPPTPYQVPDDNTVSFSFEVFHDVFGKTRGVCMPELYTEKCSDCIQCIECKALFAPQRFVNHIHRFTGTNSCHWGYKRENWKSYIKVAHGHPDYAEVVNLFETFKEQVEEQSTAVQFSSRKRKQLMDLVPVSCTVRPVRTETPQPKRTRLEEPPRTRLEETPRTRLEEPPRTRLEEPPRTRLEEPPRTRLEEPPRTRLEEPPRTRLEEPPRTRLEEPPRTRLEEPPRTKLVEEPPRTKLVEEPPRTKLVEEPPLVPPVATAAYYSALSIAPTMPNYMMDPFHYFYGAWVTQPPPAMYHMNNTSTQHLYRSESSVMKRKRPPRLVDPQKVISHTQSEQFGRSFQPNVALAPPIKQNGHVNNNNNNNNGSGHLNNHHNHNSININQHSSGNNINGIDNVTSITNITNNNNNNNSNNNNINNNMAKPTVKFKDKSDDGSQQENKTIVAPTPGGESHHHRRYNSVAANVMEQVAAVLDALSDAKETTRREVIGLVERIAMRLEKVESKNQQLVRENESLREQLNTQQHQQQQQHEGHTNKEDPKSGTVVPVVEADVDEVEEEEEEVDEVETVEAEEDCSLVKWEHNGIGTGFDRNRGTPTPLANVGQPLSMTTNKRCSPVSVITSPSCQPRTTSPPLHCAAVAMATPTTITAATSVLIKSESVD